MASSLGELFVELGVFADTKELKAFEEKLQQVSKKMDETGKNTKKTNNDFQNFIKSVRNTALAISGAIYTINRLTQSLIESNQHFLNLTRTSDIALSTFQKWDNVGRMFGVKNASQQLENLNQKLFELKLTGQGAEGFMLAGINPMGQDASGIMEQLRNRVAGLDDTAAAYLLRQMGLDPSMLHLLRLSRSEFEELGATVRKYQLTEEQTQQIQALNVQLQIATIKLRYLKDRAVLAIMPYVVKFAASLERVTRGLIGIVKGIDEFLNRVPALKEAIIAIATVIFTYFHPFLAIFSALYLLIDDVMAYMNGGGSIIGVIQKAFEDFEETGFFSDNVPEWIKLLVEAADKWLKVINWHKDKVENKEEATRTVQQMSLFDKITPEQARQLMRDMNYGNWNPYNTLPVIHPNNKNVTNNDNKQLTMNNTIYTSQSGETVINELAYAQNYAFSFV